MIRQSGLGTDGGEFRHHDFDLVSGAVLVGPGFDFGEAGVDAGGGMFIGIAAFHRLPSACDCGSARSSDARNCPTSVTTPTAWPVPRSLTLVATAGLISTHTIFTQLGSMLPVAMECSMEPRHRTNPAPFNCSAYASWAR